MAGHIFFKIKYQKLNIDKSKQNYHVTYPTNHKLSMLKDMKTYVQAKPYMWLSIEKLFMVAKMSESFNKPAKCGLR